MFPTTRASLLGAPPALPHVAAGGDEAATAGASRSPFSPWGVEPGWAGPGRSPPRAASPRRGRGRRRAPAQGGGAGSGRRRLPGLRTGKPRLGPRRHRQVTVLRRGSPPATTRPSPRCRHPLPSPPAARLASPHLTAGFSRLGASPPAASASRRGAAPLPSPRGVRPRLGRLPAGPGSGLAASPGLRSGPRPPRGASPARGSACYRVRRPRHLPGAVW